MEPIYRYPGITAFREVDRDVFFGRDTDIENLYNSILLNQSTVLSGKSGVGKSSLIYAGLKPVLRKNINENKNDERFFRILPVRVGVWTNDSSAADGQLTLLQKIRRCIGGDDATGMEREFLPSLPEDLKKSLWYRLKHLQFRHRSEYRGGMKEKLIFLLVFDQLEEIFTYPHPQFAEMLKELKEIITGNLPDPVREALEEIDEETPGLIPASELRNAYDIIPVKLLFAIRSDKLSLLNRLREAVPHIYQSLIELYSLSRQQAARAIKEPAGKEGAFLTEPFEIHDQTVKEICDFLEAQPNTDLDDNFEEHRIEPFTLQLICQHIERNIVPYDHDRTITHIEVGDPNEIIKNYYSETIDKLPLDEGTRLKVRVLIEDGMIYEPDARRLILYKEVISKEYHVSDELLKMLVDTKLIKEFGAVGGKPSYEISHDWLVIPILNCKKERLSLEQGLNNAQRFRGSIESLNEELKKNPNDYSLFKRIGDYYYFLQDYNSAIVKYSQAIRKKEQLNISGGDLELYFNRADCYLKLKEYNLCSNDVDVVLKIQPNHLMANYYKAFVNQKTEHYETAVAYYNKVIELDRSYANAYYNLGVIYGHFNDVEKSYEYYNKAIEINPGDYEALYQLGCLCVRIAYYNQNEIEKKLYQERARDFLNKAIEVQPDFYDSYIQLAQFYFYDCNEPENAITVLDRLTAVNPSHEGAWKTLGAIARAQKRTSEARKYLFKAISLNAEDHAAYYQLGTIANDEKKFSEAISALDRSIAKNPTHINSYIEKAYAYRMIQQIDNAVACYKKVLEIDPKNEMALRNLESINKYTESEKDLLAVVSENPDNVEALLDLGTLANNKGDFKKAIGYFNQILETKPDSVNAMLEMAYSYMALKDDKKAIEYYKDILKIDPKNNIVYRSLGKVYDSLSMFEEAEYHLQKAIELDSSDYDSFYRLGVIANDKKEYDRAIGCLTSAIIIKPDHTGALTERGFAFSGCRRYEEALEDYKNIVRIEPANARIYRSIGLIYEYLHDVPQAVAHYEKAVELNSSDYDAFLALGVIAHKSQNYAKAIQYFERCLEINPERIESYEYISYYYYQAKDYDSAIKHYKKLLQLNPRFADAYYNVGLAFIAKKDYEEALINFKNAIKVNPNDASSLTYIGNIYSYLQNENEAKKYFQMAQDVAQSGGQALPV